MADKAELEREVERVVSEENERLADWGVEKRYEAELGTHSQGVAIDISKDGEAVFTDAHKFFKAAHDCGYVVSNCKVFPDFGLSKGDHTRLFLHEAEERIEAEPTMEQIREAAIEDVRNDVEEEAFAEGFAAAIFLLSLWEVMGLLEGDEDLDALFDGVGEGDMDEWEEFF